MTDQDRGAYTPQTDAPLAFDARHWRDADRRPMPIMLVMSGIVLVALVAGLAVFYRSGIRNAGQAPQVVGTPLVDAKTPPSDQAAASDSAAGMQVYKSEVTPPGEGRLPTTATLTPPPETPAPRPTAPVDQAELRPAQAAAQPAPAAQPAAAYPSTPAKAAPLAAAVAATPVVAKAKPVKAAPVKLAKAVVSPSASVGDVPPGAPVAQIGAFSSAALADKGWSDVAVLMPSQMSGKSRKVEMVSANGKTFYRAFVGGFASKTAAESFCAALKASGRGCMVK
jgi:hypothetical protein